MEATVKREVNKFYLLTHLFFSAATMEAKTGAQAAAREAAAIASLNVGKRIVDRVAAEPKSVLLGIRIEQLGPVEKYWQQFLRYTKERLGDRYFQPSKKSRLIPLGSHAFSCTSFDGNKKGKNFKYAQEGIVIEGFGEPAHHMCLKMDMSELVAHLNTRTRVLSHEISANPRLQFPAPAAIEAMGARLLRAARRRKPAEGPQGPAHKRDRKQGPQAGRPRGPPRR